MKSGSTHTAINKNAKRLILIKNVYYVIVNVLRPKLNCLTIEKCVFFKMANNKKNLLPRFSSFFLVEI